MGLLKIRKLTATAVMLALYAAQTRGNSAYMKETGPPPLRFTLTTATFSFALPASLMDQISPTNATAIAAALVTSGTNTSSLQNPPSTSSTNSFVGPIASDAPTKSAQMPAASDMLVVSPQMLTEFFKPGTDGRNSGNTQAPSAPVEFTPPSAKLSSQATYKVQ